MFTWFKKLFSIVSRLDAALVRIKDLESQLTDRTSLNFDVSNMGEINHVIVIGRYKKADLVKIYTLKDSEFGLTVDQLKKMERYSHVNIIESAPEVQIAIQKEMAG